MIKEMKLTVNIKLQFRYDDEDEMTSDNTETFSKNGDITLDQLANTILYALPNQHFSPFNIMELFSDGKSVGHGERC